MAANNRLEFDDIQGFVIRGFGDLPFAKYVPFRITEAETFKIWMKSELPDKRRSDDSPPGTGPDAAATADRRLVAASVRKRSVPDICLTLALTVSGLHKLAGEHLIPDTLPVDFVNGIGRKQRSRLLGDIEPNDPGKWRWGGPNNEIVDGVLMVFAKTRNAADQFFAEPNGLENCMEQVDVILGQLPVDGKEPFGFRDGISQPVIDGTERAKEMRRNNVKEARLHVVEPGEIILGYPDGAGRLPRTPAICAKADPGGKLKVHPERPEYRDLGRNGSFMVIRQLAQDVKAFEDFTKQAANPGISANELAAKMVGRRKNGAPLTADDPGLSQNGFDYITDPKGFVCPVGAHIRRANPRSTVHAGNVESALDVTNRHRIVRRGRIYNDTKREETGLIFVCLNASISRQFEFIQSTWCNNPIFQAFQKNDPLFQGLQEEVDPIIGTPAKAGNSAYFTIPGKPYRNRVTGLSSWVTVKGGSYLFLPSLSALGVLADIT